MQADKWYKCKIDSYQSTEVYMANITLPNLPVVNAPSCGTGLSSRISQPDAETLANALKAIGHPVRLQMLDLISQREGDICGCDIERHFDLTQPTISHHLKVLKEAKLIHAEQRGVWVHYRVNRVTLLALHGILEMFNTGKK